MRGYRAVAPVRLDAAARRRLGLYRLHLYLLMTVEMPSRGSRPGPTRDAWPASPSLLDRELADLGRG